MMIYFFGKWNCDGGKRTKGKGKVLGMQKGRRRQERGVQLLRICFEVKKNYTCQLDRETWVQGITFLKIENINFFNQEVLESPFSTS